MKTDGHAWDQMKRDGHAWEEIERRRDRYRGERWRGKQ